MGIRLCLLLRASAQVPWFHVNSSWTDQSRKLECFRHALVVGGFQPEASACFALSRTCVLACWSRAVVPCVSVSSQL